MHPETRQFDTSALRRRLVLPGDTELLAPAPVIEQHHAMPVLKHGFVAGRHRNPVSVTTVIVLIGDVNESQQARDGTHALIPSSLEESRVLAMTRHDPRPIPPQRPNGGETACTPAARGRTPRAP
jgi:hypothetical protein